MSRRRPAIERFMKLIEKQPNGCWHWIGNRSPQGYGQFHRDGDHKAMRAHRFSFAHFKGEIPKGLYVCHSCDVPCCVNPEHLYTATNSENIKDAFKRGRVSHVGEKHNRAKLTERDVLTMREKRKRGETCRKLAVHYNVHVQTVVKIVGGKAWTHLPI